MKKIILPLIIVVPFILNACAPVNIQQEERPVIQKKTHSPLNTKVKTADLQKGRMIKFSPQADSPIHAVKPVISQASKRLCLETTLQVKSTDPVDNIISFRTIKEALDYAKARDFCLLNITVDSGTFPDNLEITRPTTITTATRAAITITGHILNESGHNLQIENVAILNAQDYALLMIGGGTLNLKNFVVRSTIRNPNDIRTGTAIELHGGVQGHFENVTLENNDGVALYLNGANTKVIARSFNVFDNRIHPLAIQAATNNHSVSRFAAVDVAFGATLLVDGFVIYNNEMTGVLAREAGNALLNNGYVEGTKDYQTSSFDSIGGNNVMSIYNGIVEMNNFETRYAKGCGLRAYDSYLKVQQGDVHNNTIGSCARISQEDYDILKCITSNTVRYHDNEVNLDTSTLSVPDIDCYGENPPPECSAAPNCPGVLWIE